MAKSRGYDEHDDTEQRSDKDGSKREEHLVDKKGEWRVSGEGTGPSQEDEWNNTNIWLKEKHGLRWINRVMEEERILLSFYNIEINPKLLDKDQKKVLASERNGSRNGS